MSTPAEIAAVGLGLLYLVLAVREQRLCWLAGGVSSALFLWVFWKAALPMQALLQVYYIAVAVHGWLHWGGDRGDTALPVRRWPLRWHLLSLSAVALATVLSQWLRGALDDPRAWLDSATSWGSVLATWLVARKVLENWVYWIVIDSAAALLYLGSGLPATAALFVLYTLIALQGLRQWLKSYHLANDG